MYQPLSRLAALLELQSGITQSRDFACQFANVVSSCTFRQAGQAYNACNFRQAAGPPKMLVGGASPNPAFGTRRHKLRYVRFRTKYPKAHSRPCASSPHKVCDFAGAPLPKDCLRHRPLPRLFLMSFTAHQFLLF